MTRNTAMATPVVILVLALSGHAQRNPSELPGQGQSPSVTKIEIHDPEVRQMLASDHVNVRQMDSSYVPRGPLPVLMLETVDDGLCKKRLDELIRQHSSEYNPFGAVREMNGIFAAASKSASLWVDRVSGSYKYTNWKQSMSAPQTRIRGISTAVEMALAYIKNNHLITLSKGEALDVLFVSNVRNTGIWTEDSKARNPVTTDYYVGFGRVYDGVPVIGSRLLVRFDGNGNVAMVERRWRQIIQKKTEEKATVSRAALSEIVAKSLMEREHYSESSLSFGVNIHDAQCGYMEAPLGYAQHTLRPGCVVAFFVGKEKPEMFPQIILSLEEGGTIEKLWGDRIRLIKSGSRAEAEAPQKP